MKGWIRRLAGVLFAAARALYRLITAASPLRISRSLAHWVQRDPGRRDVTAVRRDYALGAATRTEFDAALKDADAPSTRRPER